MQLKWYSYFQINQPTRCNNFSSLLLDVYSYVQLNMFRASSRPSSGAQELQQQPLVLPLERGVSSAVGRGRAGRPDQPELIFVCIPFGIPSKMRGMFITLMSWFQHTDQILPKLLAPYRRWSRRSMETDSLLH